MIFLGSFFFFFLPGRNLMRDVPDCFCYLIFDQNGRNLMRDVSDCFHYLTFDPDESSLT